MSADVGNRHNDGHFTADSTARTASFTIATGDATRPHASGPRIFAHICNDLGKWGKGFVLAVSARWQLPERRYREWAQAYDGLLPLGNTQMVQVEPQMWVANMVAQHGIRSAGGPPAIRYIALQQCLSALASHAGALNASVHLPRIGTGLAGGDWDRIAGILRASLCARGVQVTVYDLPQPAQGRTGAGPGGPADGAAAEKVN